MAPPVPDNETDRLRTLRLYHVLDAGAEKCFDDLTRLAAAICDAPMAAITLIDEDRQWLKSRIGLADVQTSRDVAFCAHAILGTELLTVEDASLDPRFADNPFVTSSPNIRFYAGAPLDAHGAALGTLCVLDRKPRRLTASQLEALGILRGAVMAQLELRRALRALDAVERLIPMCAWCRAIRRDDGTWLAPDAYVMESAPVTHGMCPNCQDNPTTAW
jgi:GAF domain-containing protein